MKNRYECHYPALEVALHTGMRLSEQFTLEWGSVDFERREIRLKMKQRTAAVARYQ